MSTNATRIRDAIFDRAMATPPEGSTSWALARKVISPTLNTAQLPALTVALIKEPMLPYGDANSGNIKFMASAQIGIVIVRAFDDPAVLDGQADLDIDHILDGLLQDNTFTNHLITSDPTQTADPFSFEAISRIDNQRRFIQTAEAYLLELSLLMTFEYRIEFSPPAPNWFEEIDLSLAQPYADAVGAANAVAFFEEGEINYAVTGPAGGAHGVAATFTLTLETGASFTGNQTIFISDGGVGGAFTSPGATPGTGSIAVQPSTDVVTFQFTYAAPDPGAVSISFMNGQNWNDAAPLTFTAT